VSQSELLDPAYGHNRRYYGQLAASAFDLLDQYASCSPGNRAYCYAKLAVSSLAVAETIAYTHCAYPRWDGQAELA